MLHRSARSLFNQGTFTARHAEGQDASIPAVRCGSGQGVSSTLSRPSWPGRRPVASIRKRPFGYARRAVDLSCHLAHTRRSVRLMPSQAPEACVGLGVTFEERAGRAMADGDPGR